MTVLVGMYLNGREFVFQTKYAGPIPVIPSSQPRESAISKSSDPPLGGGRESGGVWSRQNPLINLREVIEVPFTSKRQMRFMFSQHPKIAQKMANRQKAKSGKGVFKKLPKQARRKKK
jgi:hypothetical protein